MSPDNRIIQGLWIGPALSVMEQLGIRSFLANGHEYHLYVYETPRGVPPGTLLKDANEIISRDRIWRFEQEGFSKGSVAGFADQFRYTLLHQRGGWWADTDVVCLRPFDHANEVVIASSFECEHGVCPCNFVLKFPAGGPYTDYLTRAADRPSPEKTGYLELGPFLVQRMVRELGLQRYTAPSEDFAPIGWRGLSQRIVYKKKSWSLRSAYRYFYWRWHWALHREKDPGRIRPASYAVHLWNEFWRNGGLDKNETYAPGCVYEQLKRQYLSTERVSP